MKRQLSDEQIDRMMRTLVSDASADGSEIEAIAGSPTMWWAVQREINKQKDAVKSPWPPVGKIRRWLLIGVPVSVAATLLVTLFIFKSTPVTDIAQDRDLTLSNEIVPSVVGSTKIEPPVFPDPVAEPTTGTTPRYIAAKQTVPSRISTTASLKGRRGAKADRPEIKTEFISLSYASNAESGQLVRVKVPSSMMVTLGLVASVAKPSSLVDAEVVVGDDGLTRAIRFIR